jgi:hypothetical protein
MQIRGAASLADVPCWRKPKNRLTSDILPWARHFLKAIFAHGCMLTGLRAITYKYHVGCQSRISWPRVSFEFRGDFHKNIHAIAALNSPTFYIQSAHPDIKITLLFTIFWRILNVCNEQALDHLSRNDRFKATVYAMNTLLIHRGIYTQKEFQQLFVEWASRQGKISTQETSHEARISV